MLVESKKAIIKLDQDSKTEGEVINIIVCDDRGAQGFILPEDQLLWDCTQFVVSIGDRYKDGVFTKTDGSAVDVYKSPEQQQIDELNKQIEAMTSQLTYTTMMTETGVPANATV